MSRQIVSAVRAATETACRGCSTAEGIREVDRPARKLTVEIP